MDDVEAGSAEVTGHFSSRPLCFALLQSSLLLLLYKKIARNGKREERVGWEGGRGWSGGEGQNKEEAILGDVFSEKNIDDSFTGKAETRLSRNNFQATMNGTRAFN